jgi:hypothetical protein
MIGVFFHRLLYPKKEQGNPMVCRIAQTVGIKSPHSTAVICVIPSVMQGYISL